jgi:hypothetical protein
MSGKRNELEDLGIVDFQRAWLLGRDEREGNTARALPGARTQLDFNAPENQLLHGAFLAGSFGFELAVERVGNVDGGAHTLILPCLRLSLR